MKGLMGRCPDWYEHVQIARYLGISPKQLQEDGIWWKDIARKCMNAEASARESLEKTGR